MGAEPAKRPQYPNRNLLAEEGETVKPTETLTDKDRIIAEQQKINEQLQKTIEAQQQMLEKATKAKLDQSPYAISKNVKELPLVERHNALIEKHRAEGLTERELSELYQVRNDILRIRGVDLFTKEQAVSGGDRKITKTFDQRRTTYMKVPPGYHIRWIKDSETLGGERIRRALDIGMRPLSKSQKIITEADGLVFDTKGVGNMLQKPGGHDEKGHPVTLYAFIEPIELQQIRAEEKNKRNANLRRKKISDSVEELKNITQNSRGMATVYGGAHLTA